MATHHGIKELGGLHPLCDPGVARSDRFGRLLPHAPPLYTNPAHLALIGDKNDPMKSSGPTAKTTSVAVGQVFFGQFVDHDITLDVSSSFARLAPPRAITNVRTPVLDLDCIYGGGPQPSPCLYWNTSGAGQEFNGIKLLTGADVPGQPPRCRRISPARCTAAPSSPTRAATRAEPF